MINCPKNNQNFCYTVQRIETEPVSRLKWMQRYMSGFWARYIANIASAPAFTGSGSMRRLKLFLGQCAELRYIVYNVLYTVYLADIALEHKSRGKVFFTTVWAGDTVCSTVPLKLWKDSMLHGCHTFLNIDGRNIGCSQKSLFWPQSRCVVHQSCGKPIMW